MRINLFIILLSFYTILNAQNHKIDSLKYQKEMLIKENILLSDTIKILSKHINFKDIFPVSDDSLNHILRIRKQMTKAITSNNILIKKLKSELKKEDSKLVKHYFKIEPQYILLNEFSIFDEHVLSKNQCLEMSLGINYALPIGEYPSLRLLLLYISGLNKQSLCYNGIVTRFTHRINLEEPMYFNYGFCFKYNFVNKGPVYIGSDSNFHQNLQTRTDKLFIPAFLIELGGKFPPYKNNINVYMRLTYNYKVGQSTVYDEYWDGDAPTPPSRTDFPYKNKIEKFYMTFNLGCKITLLKIKDKELKKTIYFDL